MSTPPRPPAPPCGRALANALTAAVLVVSLGACQATVSGVGPKGPGGPRAVKSAAPLPQASASTPGGTSSIPAQGAASPAIAATQAPLLPAGSLRGRVLDLAGQPAVGVLVRAQLLSDHGAGVLSDGGGSLVANNSGSYRLLATEVRTDPDGRFSLALPADQVFGVEAVQSDELKAIKLGVTAAQGEVELQLNHTGSIEGQVTAPEQPAITDFEGIDVFIPGTSYAAKTDSAGKFRLSGVPVGTFEVVASRESLGSARATGVAVQPRAGTTVAALALSSQVPRITALSARTLHAGETLTLTGLHFGASTGKAVGVTIGGLAAGSLVRKDDTSIQVVVPLTAPSGDVVVTVGGVASAPLPLTVLKRRAEPGVSTLAGSTFGYSDGTGSGAAFYDLGGVAVGPEGVIYVADNTNKAVRRLVGTTVTTLLGPPRDGPAPAEFPLASPVDVAVDSTGRVYVLDTTKGLVRLTPGTAGAVPAAETLFDLSDKLGTRPALAIGPDDLLYVLVSEGGVDKVAKADLKAASPSLTTFLGGGDSADGSGPARELTDPVGLAAAPDGGIWLSDARRGVVERFGPDGTRTFVAGPGEDNGEVLDGQGPAATFEEVGDLALAPDGTLYLVDGFTTMRIRAISPSGEVKTVSGGDWNGSYVDGPAASATFGTIGGLAVDGHGNVLITDAESYRVRKLTFFDP